MDKVLEIYWKGISRRTRLAFPRFSEEAVHIAPLLAILETPGNSGAEESRVCSLNNNDPTAARNLRIICSVGLRRKQIVFWNFYAAYRPRTRNREFWARELEKLIAKMPKLKAIVVFGNAAWLGMRDVKLRNGVMLIGAPHPSNRACNANPKAEKAIEIAWKRAKALL